MNADAIVKALKCCNVPSGRACSECPYHEVGAKCRTQRNKDAVELILKLTEENRNLEEVCCVNATIDDELLERAIQQLKKSNVQIVPTLEVDLRDLSWLEENK